MPRPPSALAAATLALLAAVPAAGAPPAPPLADALRAHVRFLADDLLEGRDTGTRGYRIAAAYVAARFAALGLEPAGDDGYLQSVPLLESRLAPESARLTVRRGAESVPLAWGRHFLMGGSAAHDHSTLTAPVVFAGHGVVAPELGHDDYADLDVAGKIVLYLSGAPASFPHDQRAHHSSSRTKAATAVARGAAGLLSVATRERERRVPWERVLRWAGRPDQHWLREDGMPQDAFPELRAAASLSQTGAALLFAGARRSLDEVLDEAERRPPRGFPLAVEATLEQRTEHRRLRSPNVAALLAGGDPSRREEVVLFTAHLDHVGLGEPVAGDAIHNGAYDNAMGVAVLLEAARLAVEREARPGRSLLFLAVTAEEHGLLGADYFAHHPTVPIDRLVANVNLDMPLFLYPVADVVAFGAEHSTLEPLVARAAAREGFALSPDPMPEEVLFVRSDQYPFVRQGVPAIYLVPGLRSADPARDGARLTREFLDRHYHRPSDDPSQPVDWPSAERFTRLNLAIGLAIADAPERPRWKPGDFFGELFGKGR